MSEESAKVEEIPLKEYKGLLAFINDVFKKHPFLSFFIIAWMPTNYTFLLYATLGEDTYLNLFSLKTVDSLMVSREHMVYIPLLVSVLLTLFKDFIFLAIDFINKKAQNLRVKHIENNDLSKQIELSKQENKDLDLKLQNSVDKGLELEKSITILKGENLSENSIFGNKYLIKSDFGIEVEFLKNKKIGYGKSSSLYRWDLNKGSFVIFNDSDDATHKFYYFNHFSMFIDSDGHVLMDKKPNNVKIRKDLSVLDLRIDFESTLNSISAILGEIGAEMSDNFTVNLTTATGDIQKYANEPAKMKHVIVTLTSQLKESTEFFTLRNQGYKEEIDKLENVVLNIARPEILALQEEEDNKLLVEGAKAAREGFTFALEQLENLINIMDDQNFHLVDSTLESITNSANYELKTLRDLTVRTDEVLGKFISLFT